MDKFSKAKSGASKHKSKFMNYKSWQSLRDINCQIFAYQKQFKRNHMVIQIYNVSIIMIVYCQFRTYTWVLNCRLYNTSTMPKIICTGKEAIIV